MPSSPITCILCGHPRQGTAEPFILLLRQENYYERRIAAFCEPCWQQVEHAVKKLRS